MATLQDRLTAAFQAVGGDIKTLLGRSLPSGGTTGQVLTKTSATDYATSWQTPGGFSGDAALIPYAATIPKGLASGTVVDQSQTATSASSAGQTANSVRGGPVVMPYDFRFSAFGLYCQTAASSGTNETYYSIYQASAGGFYPGTRLYISPAALTTFSSTGLKSQTLDMTLNAYTVYWFFAHFGSNPSVSLLAPGTMPTLGLQAATSNSHYASVSATRNITTPMASTFDIFLNSGSLVSAGAPSWRFTVY